MKTFLTYFDFLGYKNFIQHNNSEQVKERVLDILRNIEQVLGQGNIKETQYGIIADLDKTKINFLNISDTVVLWTNDTSEESFNEILKVTFDFNWRLNCYIFPVKGAMVFDDFDIITANHTTNAGGTYNVNSIYGKGIVNAHLKAENLNFAGCIIDSSVIEEITKFGKVEDKLNLYSLLYNVPYKTDGNIEPEYVFTFYENDGKKNPKAVENRGKAIEKRFNGDNKEMTDRAKTLLQNTLTFLEEMNK